MGNGDVATLHWATFSDDSWWSDV